MSIYRKHNFAIFALTQIISGNTDTFTFLTAASTCLQVVLKIFFYVSSVLCLYRIHSKTFSLDGTPGSLISHIEVRQDVFPL